MRHLMITAFALGALAIGCNEADRASTEAASAQITLKANPTQPKRASLDLTCGSKTYTVSTGNNQGTCTAGDGAASCNDGHGNSAHVGCHGGCSAAYGSGSCTGK